MSNLNGESCSYTMSIANDFPDDAKKVDARRRLVSIVVPVYNEEENVRTAYDALSAVFRLRKQYDVEFIFTDNHSEDATFVRLKEIAALDPRVKVLRFNRNYGFQRSLLTGYRLAHGDAVVQIDCDLQDPPERILDFLDLWECGHDVVVGIRRRREENYFLAWGRRAFYAFINHVSDDHITRDAGDFRLIDRTVIDRVIALNDINPYIRGLSSAFSINEAGVPCDRVRRKYGRSKFPLRRLVHLASDGVFSMTLFPLRLAGYISLIISAVTISMALYYFAAAIFYGNDWPGGFATLVLLLLLSISLNGMFLAIIGKYLGQIYLQQQNRPLVIIEGSINVSNDFVSGIVSGSV